MVILFHARIQIKSTGQQKRQRHHRSVYIVWVASTGAWIGFIIHDTGTVWVQSLAKLCEYISGVEKNCCFKLCIAKWSRFNFIYLLLAIRGR